MSMNLEAINAMRKINGQDPLTELPKGDANGDNNEGGVLTEEQKKAAELKAEQDKEAARLQAEKEKGGANPEDQELSDEQLLKLLERKGIKAATLADLTHKEPDADPEKAAEAREIAKLTYGLNKGKFTKKQYDSFVADKNDPKNLYYAKFHADAKKEDPTLTDEDIEQEFIQEHGLDADPKSRKYRLGQEKIGLMATQLLNEKYGNIISVDQEYDGYEKQQKTQKAFETKVVAEAPVYKKTIQEVFSEFKKIPAKFSDEDEYSVEAAGELEKSLKGIEEMMTDPKFVAQQIGKGYTKEELKETAWMLFLRDNWPLLAKEVANQHLNKYAAGTKGIPKVGTTQSKENLEGFTEAQKRLIELNKQQAASTAN